MGIKLKTAIINCSAIIANIGIGFLLCTLFTRNSTSNFMMFACGTALLSTIIVLMIANRSNLKLDLYSTDTENIKFFILNFRL